MIDHISGRVSAKSAGSCVIEVGGMGLRLAMATGAIARLPAVGDEVTVFTYLHIREDGLSLFGFESPEEQDLFEKLISVSGVGPKVALAALSALSPTALVAAVADEDDTFIATVPGIGRKTAQRIIIELKDRLGPAGAGLRPQRHAGARAEAADALASMGFSQPEIAAAVKGYDGPDDAQALLRHALKRLGAGR
jgi:Holliday junction DNA helicase RuvA